MRMNPIASSDSYWIALDNRVVFEKFGLAILGDVRNSEGISFRCHSPLRLMAISWRTRSISCSHSVLAMLTVLHDSIELPDNLATGVLL